MKKVYDDLIIINLYTIIFTAMIFTVITQPDKATILFLSLFLSASSFKFNLVKPNIYII